MSYISVEQVSKSYQMGYIETIALNKVSFQLVKGDFTLIVGPSGGGKSTILNLLGGMDRCTRGKIFVDREEITAMSEKELCRFRRQEVGFVFQFYNLMPNLTALENVEIATKVAVAPLYERDMLDRVGLKERRHHFPAQLSGGEQQRVAIARALAKKPKILLCDEPTGALDSETGKSILQLLQETAHLYEMTVVVITHNQSLVPLADRVIYMKNGGIDQIVENRNPTLARSMSW